MAEAMDHDLGRLIAHLQIQTGEFDNTVFVFLSDNGSEGSDYADAQIWLATTVLAGHRPPGRQGRLRHHGSQLGQRGGVAAVDVQVLCRRGRHPGAADHQPACRRMAPTRSTTA
jgi:arylsulfatase A-like enzyme